MTDREPVEHMETGLAFWDIVVNMAAEDELVTRAALDMLAFDTDRGEQLDPAAVLVEKALYDGLANYVEIRYGLPEEFLDEVLNRAEVRLQEGVAA